MTGFIQWTAYVSARDGSFALMQSARFSGACPLLPESDSQPPKCVPSLRANNGSN